MCCNGSRGVLKLIAELQPVEVMLIFFFFPLSKLHHHPLHPPPSFFTTESNHPLSLRSLASQGEGCSAGLQQTWQSPGKTPCCSMGHTSSFAKSNNTFSELKVRFKWGSTMWPTLSSLSWSFSLCASV